MRPAPASVEKLPKIQNNGKRNQTRKPAPRRSAEQYNKEHGITPKTIIKEIRDVISNEEEVKEDKKQKLSKKDKTNMILNLTKEMNLAAKNLDFERAAQLRDILFEMKAGK